MASHARPPRTVTDLEHLLCADSVPGRNDFTGVCRAVNFHDLFGGKPCPGFLSPGRESRACDAASSTRSAASPLRFVSGSGADGLVACFADDICPCPFSVSERPCSRQGTGPHFSFVVCLESFIRGLEPRGDDTPALQLFPGNPAFVRPMRHQGCMRCVRASDPCGTRPSGASYSLRCPKSAWPFGRLRRSKL